tara:strand:+ start:864 stop:1196 length:333 start_codon:yes stop_codon:yes gene_type:complete
MTNFNPEDKADHVHGILYALNGEMYILNDTGNFRVVLENEEGMLQPAIRLLEIETTDVQWKGDGMIETWDSNILSDLLHDMTEDGRDPNKDINYLVKDCRSILICGENKN